MELKYDSEQKLWKSAQFPFQLPADVFLGEKILEHLDKTPERVLQISHDENSSLTCKELKISSIRVAQNLQKLGIEADDVIGMICENSNCAASLIIGCLLFGAPMNPLDNSFKKNEIKQLYRQMKPKLVVCDVDVYPMLKQALDELENDALIFTTLGSIPNVPSVDELLEPTGMENEFVPPKFSKSSSEKIAAILCSSGTTGASKGVCITHIQCLKFIGMPSSPVPKVTLNFSSIFWSSGFYPYIMGVFTSTSLRIVTKKRFDIKLLIELVEKYKVTSLSTPPYQLALMLQSDDFRRSNHSSLKEIHCIGSVVSVTIRKQFQKIFPDKLLMIAYGMTELLISITRPGERIDNQTVGSMIIPNLVLKVVDENEQRLEIGQPGEIRVISPTKFIGYYNDPDATRDAIDSEGFLKTGDIGYFNESGSLFIIDRKKEVMKYKNYQVNPSEIENVIQSIDGVEQVCVFGMLDSSETELPTAAVIRKCGFEALTEKEIADHVALNFPVFKHLHGGVFFFNQFPMTPSGKIQKRFVQQLIKERL